MRFFAKIACDGSVRACWRWTGAQSSKRYGQRRPIMRDATGRVRTVARQVCERVWGPPPDPTYHAGHTCPHGEQSDCVNPLHLVWQTPEENQSWRRARSCSR